MKISDESIKDKRQVVKAQALLLKTAKRLKNCMDWMESLRISGDAGYWEWEDDAYTEATELFKEINEYAKERDE